MKIRKLAGKKGQEEIVGFVLIVVIVAIVFLVFLGIMLRQKSSVNQKSSKDVVQFLDSTAEYTSGCAIGYEPRYSNLGDLLKNCNSGESCTSGKSACEVLKSDLGGLIEAGWRIGPTSPNRGYIVNVTYNSTRALKDVVSFSKGNCSFSRIGGDKFFKDLTITLQICVVETKT